jgi:hypothetical protein
MIPYDEAKLLAKNTVAAIAAKVCDEFVVIDDLTKEVEEGWVFFYDSKEFVETGNPSSTLAGNGPILVRRNGEIQILPSNASWQVILKRSS